MNPLGPCYCRWFEMSTMISALLLPRHHPSTCLHVSCIVVRSVLCWMDAFGFDFWSDEEVWTLLRVLVEFDGTNSLVTMKNFKITFSGKWSVSVCLSLKDDTPNIITLFQSMWRNIFSNRRRTRSVWSNEEGGWFPLCLLTSDCVLDYSI